MSRHVCLLTLAKHSFTESLWKPGLTLAFPLNLLMIHLLQHHLCNLPNKLRRISLCPGSFGALASSMDVVSRAATWEVQDLRQTLTCGSHFPSLLEQTLRNRVASIHSTTLADRHLELTSLNEPLHERQTPCIGMFWPRPRHMYTKLKTRVTYCSRTQKSLDFSLPLLFQFFTLGLGTLISILGRRESLAVRTQPHMPRFQQLKLLHNQLDALSTT